MDLINMLIGILLIIMGVVLFIYERKNYLSLRKNQYFQKTYYTDSFILCYVLVFIGFAMFFKELI